MPLTFRPPLLGLLLAAAPLSSQAVVVAGGDGTQNTTAPANDFGFASVGQLFSPTDGFFQSCVYLEGNWILTAYHTVRDASGTGFSLGQVIFRDPNSGDIAFQPVEGTAVRLRNADDSFTDLALFQISSVPAFLTETVIASATPAVGSPLILAGNGISRQPELTRWSVNILTEPDTWTEVPIGGNQQGYKLIAQTGLRWGTNTLESNSGSPTLTTDAGYGPVTLIRTDFDNISGEAQGVAGDSGGGVFYNGTLLGIIVTRDYKNGQQQIGVDTAVFGNSTYAAHLPTYREQILATIPEPSTAGLLIVGLSGLLMRRRR